MTFSEFGAGVQYYHLQRMWRHLHRVTGFFCFVLLPDNCRCRERDGAGFTHTKQYVRSCDTKHAPTCPHARTQHEGAGAHTLAQTHKHTYARWKQTSLVVSNEALATEWEEGRYGCARCDHCLYSSVGVTLNVL